MAKTIKDKSIKLGDVVLVTNRAKDWTGGSWENTLAVATLTKEPRYPFCFQIISRSPKCNWPYAYFHTSTEAFDKLEVIGHLDVRASR